MMQKGHYTEVSENELLEPDLILTILAVAEKIRMDVYDKFVQEYGLSEGNISLLMTLACNGPQGVVELSEAMGVKPATASVMIKRMCVRSSPLVQRIKDAEDARAKVIRLTATGRKFIKDRLLPELDQEMKKFANAVNDEEKEEIVRLLNKLLVKE